MNAAINTTVPGIVTLVALKIHLCPRTHTSHQITFWNPPGVPCYARFGTSAQQQYPLNTSFAAVGYCWYLPRVLCRETPAEGGTRYVSSVCLQWYVRHMGQARGRLGKPSRLCRDP